MQITNNRTPVRELPFMRHRYFNEHESVTCADIIMVLGALHPDATGSEAWWNLVLHASLLARIIHDFNISLVLFLFEFVVTIKTMALSL